MIRKTLPIALVLGTCLSLSLSLALAGCTDKASEADAPAATASQTPAPAAPSATAAGSTLSAWTGDLTGGMTSQMCALDAMNGAKATAGRFESPTAQPATMEGWVASSDMHAPAALSVVLDGPSDFQITGTTGVSRADVAKAYNAENLATAGFKIELAGLAVPAGEYKVLIAHQEGGGAWVSCDTNTVLSVK